MDVISYTQPCIYHIKNSEVAEERPIMMMMMMMVEVMVMMMMMNLDMIFHKVMCC